MAIKKNQEVIEIDSITPDIITAKGISVIRDTPFGEKDKLHEKRVTLFHFVVHLLAFIIVVPFVVMIAFGATVPREYSTIVSLVIGFYFGRALFN